MRKTASIAGITALSLIGMIAAWFYFSPRCTSGDCAQGCGIREQRNVFRYEGCFRNGKAHGKGTFSAVTGDVYSGDWVNGAKHGRGSYRYPDGSRYEGDW